MEKFPLCAVGTILISIFPGIASADLQFCNRTSFEVYAAVGEKPNYDYLSTGWHYIPRDSCRIVVQGDLDKDAYWAFAINTGQNYKTAGDRRFCVIDDKAFSGLDSDNCQQSNRRRERFATINVGYADDYTVYFEGRAYDTSANITSSQGIEDSGANAGFVSGGGSGCTSELKMCGDPSASGFAAMTVPNLSDRSVVERVSSKIRYGNLRYDDQAIVNYMRQIVRIGF